MKKPRRAFQGDILFIIFIQILDNLHEGGSLRCILRLRRHRLRRAQAGFHFFEDICKGAISFRKLFVTVQEVFVSPGEESRKGLAYTRL